MSPSTLASTVTPISAPIDPGTASRSTSRRSMLPKRQWAAAALSPVATLARFTVVDTAADDMPVPSRMLADVGPKPMPSAPSTRDAAKPARNTISRSFISRSKVMEVPRNGYGPYGSSGTQAVACPAMTAATVNGITIEYDVHGGDGDEPLLLVMGLGGQMVAWPLEFVDRLVAKGFRVIRFDNRDIGLSTMMPAPAPTKRQVLLSVVSRRFAKSSYLLG